MTALETITLARINAFELVLIELNKVPKKTRTAARTVMAQLLREEETWKYILSKQKKAGSNG